LLDEIVPSIRKTSDLVQEIAAASQEQSQAVGQIGGAMSQLNKATQQNAAASEELAATSEELTGQAGQLQEAVAFFRSARETAAAPRSHGEMTRFTERRAPNSPMRSPSATSAAAFSAPVAGRGQATGTHGNFRPY
ncbi:hypothetical protein IP87_20915, partial [beta proteobacterium AAP121]